MSELTTGGINFEYPCTFKIDREAIEKHDKALRKLIEKAFAIEELEKIKAECNDLLEFHGERKDDYGIGKIQAYQHIIEFVNERISEIKGE